jgi:transcriptional regulator with XRE-family HTH domain
MAQKLNLKKIREGHGMSQTDLAKRLDMSRPTLIKVEKGERRLSQVEEAKVGEIFDIVTIHAGVEENIRISIPQKRLEKFEQVFLYLLERTAGKPNVGMTVLYKLLYFIDFDYYEKFEEQLMGLTYIKNTHGPTPREFISVVDSMKKSGQLEEVKSAYFTYEQRKFLPHRHADLSMLSAQETAMIDSVLARYADKSGRELSNLSHEDTPWAVAEEGKNIEYDHVFYRPEKFSVRQYDEL